MTRPGFGRTALLFLAGLFLVGCSSEKPPVASAPVLPGYGSPEFFANLTNKFLNDTEAEPNKKVASDKIPLTFVDLDGKQVDLASFRAKSNVVLVMTKGMPQTYYGSFCPGCLAQMNSLVNNLAEFKKREAEVLVVFPGPPEKAGEFLTNAKASEAGKPSPIPLLLDKDLVAVKLLDIQGENAKPSTYIIDRKGNVVYAFVGQGATDRPSVKALLTQLDKLNAKK